MPDNTYTGCDSFSYWLEKSRRKLNVDIAKTVSLKFKKLSDAELLKRGISSGTIKAWFSCKFMVGFPSDWIVRQGHYKLEKKEVKGLGIILTIAQAILHEGMADEHDDTLYERKVWCPTVVGKVVPIKIIESKIIIEGELAKTMDVEVVSSTGVWTLEKCST